MHKLKLLLCIMIVLIPTVTFAQAPASDVIFEQMHGDYRVTATIDPSPPTIGPAKIRVTITNAQTGVPQPVSAVILLVSAKHVGQTVTIIAPPDQTNPNAGVYITERLNFPTSDTWNIVYRISTPNETFELSGDIEVHSVYGNIGKAALIAVPLTLAAIAAAFVGYRLWRKKVGDRR